MLPKLEAIGNAVFDLVLKDVFGLPNAPRVRVVGPTTADQAVRVPTVSFVVDGVDSQTIVRHVDAWQIGMCARCPIAPSHPQ